MADFISDRSLTSWYWNKKDVEINFPPGRPKDTATFASPANGGSIQRKLDADSEVI
jgi:hypothetical protein